MQPEADGKASYIGQIVSMFCNTRASSGCSGEEEEFCVEVKWFIRLHDLSFRGLQSHEASAPPHLSMGPHEIIEIEGDTDVNPIGCIQGKALVIRAASMEQVRGNLHGIHVSCEWRAQPPMLTVGEEEDCRHATCEPAPSEQLVLLQRHLQSIFQSVYTVLSSS